MKYLAVDIGASSGKIVSGELEGKRLISQTVHRFANKLEMNDGYLVWNLERLYGEIVQGLRNAGAADYVSIDTWGVDFVLLDAEDRVIGKTVSYRDERTARLTAVPDHAHLYERTGIQKQRFNTIYQLLSIKQEHPEWLEKAQSLLFIPDYFNFRLTGVKKQEFTFASTSNLVNSEKHSWDYELIRELGLPEHLFTELSEPGTVVGRTLPETGVDMQVLLAPSHDTASAVYGAPLTERSLFLSSGTWSLIGAVTDRVYNSEKAFASNFTNEGGVNRSVRLLRNIMGSWMLQSLRSESGVASFDELEAAAKSAELVGYVDPSEDCFLAPASMKGAVDAALERGGYRASADAGECAKVIYHSLARAYKQSAEEISQITGHEYDHIAIVGGGCKDEYLDSLTAEYTSMKVTAGPDEGTAIGNLLHQMVSSGELAESDRIDVIRRSFNIRTFEKEKTE